MRGEFDFIKQIRGRYSLGEIGDDCAVIPKNSEYDQVITADMLVEDVDFRLKWTTPEFIGHKSLAVSLSDLAAMGAEPKWAMLSLAVPEKVWASDFLDRFYAGWQTLAGEFGVELIGGDVSRSPDRLIIDSIAGGDVPRGKAFMRSGAKPGDAVFVTGTLGSAAGGLKLLELGEHLKGEVGDGTRRLLLSQLKPFPALRESALLRSLGIPTAMIDISDGLAADLRHICEQSGVGARIDCDLLPIDPALTERFGAEQAREFALGGGEDFELLFTVDEKTFPSEGIPGIARIGIITPKIGEVEFFCDGTAIIPWLSGFRHF